MTRWYRIDGELIDQIRAVLGELARMNPEWRRVSRALRNELDLLIPDREDFPRLDRSELIRLWDDIFGINSSSRDIPFLQIQSSSSDQDDEEDASTGIDLEELLRRAGLKLRDRSD